MLRTYQNLLKTNQQYIKNLVKRIEKTPIKNLVKPTWNLLKTWFSGSQRLFKTHIFATQRMNMFLFGSKDLFETCFGYPKISSKPD